MKLIRNGVFETNSSSAHSLAYTNKVLRDYEYKTNTYECMQDSRFRLTEMPEEYREYRYMPLYFDDYGWSGKRLTSPANKLSYLLTSVYQYKTWGEMYNDEFFKKIVQWLTEMGIDLEYEYPGDEERIDGGVDHQSYDVVCKQMFSTKEDLLTYLFNDAITVYIENDNDDFQEWVEDPKGEIGYQEAMYWCVSKDKCVRRKSWGDGTYLIYGIVKDEDDCYELGYLIINNQAKCVYTPNVYDTQVSDWMVALEVNKYEINKK